MSATPRDTATRVTSARARAMSMPAAFVLFAAVRAYPPTRELCALQRCEDLPGLFPAEYPPNAMRSRERSHLDAVLSSGMRLPTTCRHAARTHLNSWALAYREAHVATLRSPDAPYPRLRGAANAPHRPCSTRTTATPPRMFLAKRALLVAYHLWLAAHPFGPHIPSPRERASHGLRA